MQPRAIATLVAAVFLMFFVADVCAQSKGAGEQRTGVADREVAGAIQEGKPLAGVRVILSVYSGQPNPTWTMAPGPELDRLLAQIKELKTTDAELFHYDEWNRLGYASFWLVVHGVSEAPQEVHLWRDMAIAFSKERKGRQAVGASDLYEFLVTQAEDRGYAQFFVNYRKLRPAKREAQ